MAARSFSARQHAWTPHVQSIGALLPKAVTCSERPKRFSTVMDPTTMTAGYVPVPGARAAAMIANPSKSHAFDSQRSMHTVKMQQIVTIAKTCPHKPKATSSWQRGEGFNAKIATK